MRSAALRAEGNAVEDFDQRSHDLLEQADRAQANWAQAYQAAEAQRLAQVQRTLQHVQGRLAQAAAQSSERLTYIQRAVRDSEGQASLRHILEWTPPYPSRQLVLVLDEPKEILQWGWGWGAPEPNTPSGGAFQTELQEEVPFALVTPVALDRLVLRLADQSRWQGGQPPSGSLVPPPPNSLTTPSAAGPP
jgi:hypothetical protein